MPMTKWSAPVGGPHGGTLEIRAPGGEVVYTLIDSPGIERPSSWAGSLVSTAAPTIGD
jgi:hypothetical protein